MAIHKLTTRKIETAKPGQYEDGDGLRLFVSKFGRKRWTLRFSFRGKRHEMGLGRYPVTSLSMARADALKYHRLVAQNINPIHQRRSERDLVPTFTHCAARYIIAHRHEWKSRKHAFQWVRTLKTYVTPIIGSMPVDHIHTEDVLKVLNPIWRNKTETAKRIQGRIENVLDYAAAFKYRDRINPARWRGHLDMLLAKPSKLRQVKHHPAMPYYDVPKFMAELSQNKCYSAQALQLLILTATRTSEVLEAPWSEFDLNTCTWTIPANRMKTGVEHKIPLSNTAMKILTQLPRVEDHPFVFPGYRKNRPLSGMSMLQLMRGMEYGRDGTRGDYVPHGFRSSFRDWSGEVSSFPRDVAEMALAHTIGNKVEAAYRRGDLFTKRSKMMQTWADYLKKATTVTTVVPIQGQK